MFVKDEAFRRLRKILESKAVYRNVSSGKKVVFFDEAIFIMNMISSSGPCLKSLIIT